MLAAALLVAPSASATTLTNGRIAYSSSANQIFTISAAGQDPSQITHEAGTPAHPDWSPDGRLIAYDVNGMWLKVATATGAAERTVTVDTSAIDPSWSPDASQLAFTAVEYDQYGNPENTSIYVTQADGSGNRRIGPGSEPDWSPRADWIVYRSNPARTGGCAGIWRMHSDGTDNGPVAEGIPDGATCSGGGSDPSFSPNGKRVAFVSGDGRSIFTVSLHGGNKHRVVRDARPKASPVFSPDGRKIAYSTSGPDAGIWVVRAKGGKPRRIARASGYVAWQPLPR